MSTGVRRWGASIEVRRDCEGTVSVLVFAHDHEKGWKSLVLLASALPGDCAPIRPKSYDGPVLRVGTAHVLFPDEEALRAVQREIGWLQ